MSCLGSSWATGAAPSASVDIQTHCFWYVRLLFVDGSHPVKVVWRRITLIVLEKKFNSEQVELSVVFI